MGWSQEVMKESMTAIICRIAAPRWVEEETVTACLRDTVRGYGHRGVDSPCGGGWERESRDRDDEVE